VLRELARKAPAGRELQLAVTERARDGPRRLGHSLHQRESPGGRQDIEFELRMPFAQPSQQGLREHRVTNP
jgi:hypothetical protein